MVKHFIYMYVTKRTFIISCCKH